MNAWELMEYQSVQRDRR